MEKQRKIVVLNANQASQVLAVLLSHSRCLGNRGLQLNSEQKFTQAATVAEDLKAVQQLVDEITGKIENNA